MNAWYAQLAAQGAVDTFPGRYTCNSADAVRSGRRGRAPHSQSSAVQLCLDTLQALLIFIPVSNLAPCGFSLAGQHAPTLLSLGPIVTLTAIQLFWLSRL